MDLKDAWIRVKSGKGIIDYRRKLYGQLEMATLKGWERYNRLDKCR